MKRKARWYSKNNNYRLRLTKQYQDWKSNIFKRDKCCQYPDCRSRRCLQAHHIFQYSKFPSLRYSLLNGILLCYKHHKMVTGHEHLYTSMFRKIVNDNTRR